MALPKKLQAVGQSPWVISFILLSVFFITTSYKYGWDDQHLEIPLLKHLIDPSLFAGDYYVESLTKNFSSYFYPILSRLITVDQIPAAYFILYIISRYFLFFFSYKLWLHLSGGSRFKGIYCVLIFILVTRVDEFLYRTFSHQEFALAIIAGGIYYFFKERFILSAFILGLAANIHGVYSLFPMFYICLYLFWQVRRHGIMTLIKACTIYILAALPFIIWVIHNRLSKAITSLDPHDPNWLSLFITACPQNFFFSKAPQIPLKVLFSDFRVFVSLTQEYLYLLSLFILNLTFNSSFRKNKKVLSFCIGGFSLLMGCLIFTYFHPNRFLIDLNLIRNTQFLLFILSGFTCLLVIETVERENIWFGFMIVLAFSFLKLGDQTAILGIGFMILILCLTKSLKSKNTAAKIILSSIAILGISGIVVITFQLFQSFLFGKSIQWLITGLPLALMIGTLLVFIFFRNSISVVPKRILPLIPTVLFLIQFGIYHNFKIQEETKGGGFWRLQRNWEDMQRYTKDHTPKDAVLLIPYNMEMCGFRILSERKIVVSYRDIGLIGFDYSTAREWQKRIHDVEEFKFVVKEFPLRAVKNAIEKYKANYIVFMNNVAPVDSSIFKRLYSNEFFSLYKVLLIAP